MHEKYKRYVSTLWVFMCFVPTCVLAQDKSQYLPCLEQPMLQQERSLELQRLVDADQNERADWEHLSDDDKLRLIENDLTRRKRVGEILGEGCFKTAEDYAAASLIYQHGDVPDHYFQAFIWANRAVALGDSEKKHLVALTIDRYLVSIGKKQLFGSQAYSEDGACFCLQPVEASFPDALRREYTGMSLQERYDWLISLNQEKNCTSLECSTDLQLSPQGCVPGFW